LKKADRKTVQFEEWRDVEKSVVILRQRKCREKEGMMGECDTGRQKDGVPMK
jgi:hypothetical protein